jgi:hypothetical protein
MAPSRPAEYLYLISDDVGQNAKGMRGAYRIELSLSTANPFTPSLCPLGVCPCANGNTKAHVSRPQCIARICSGKNQQTVTNPLPRCLLCHGVLSSARPGRTYLNSPYSIELLLEVVNHKAIRSIAGQETAKVI